MKVLLSSLLALAAISSVTPAQANQSQGVLMARTSLEEFLLEIDGKAVLVAEDGTFLGVVSSNQRDPESICNLNGIYGNSYAIKSVRNEYSLYGGEYGLYSPYNPYTIKPPAIFYQGEPITLVTKNEYLVNRLPLPPIDPNAIFVVYGCY